MFVRRLRWLVAAAIGTVPTAAPAQLPTPDHVVVLVLENKGYTQIVGSSQAPYLNSLIPQGGLLTNSFGLTHPSQPNYLGLYSGSLQGVTTNDTPTVLPFTTPNLGAQLLNSGRTFTGYSESLPSVGFTGDSSGSYMRKHNPWVNWQQVGPGPHHANTFPAAVNQPFTSFPTDYATLPTVSFVVPNQANDMHDGTIAQGDAWVSANLGGYVSWAKTHNSMLLVTFDEDNNLENNRIYTMFVGAGVVAGSSDATVYNHYNVLGTIQDMYGLGRTAGSVGVPAINGIFTPVPEPSGWVLSGIGFVVAAVARGRARRPAAGPALA